jgi:hypothetical protein
MATKNRAEKWNGDVEHFALELSTEHGGYGGYSGGQYFHVKGRIVGCEEYGDQKRNGMYWASFNSELGQDLKGLELSCQSDSDKRNQPEREPTYAWTLCYRQQDVTIENAERWARVLKTTHARLDKMQAEDGYCDNFGQWVLRVCKALGIKMVRVPQQSPYSDDTHRVITPAEAKDWVNKRIADWINPPRIESSRAVVVS